MIDISEEENFQMEDKNFQMEDKNFQMKDKYSQLNIKLQLAKKSGQIFRKKFMKTSKYNSFAIKFCKNNEANDVNKIPYKFINEFIYYSDFYFSKDLKEIFFFKIIDQFYGKIKLLDFEKASYKMQKEVELEKNKQKGKIQESKIKTKEIFFSDTNTQESKYFKDIRIKKIEKYDNDLQNIYLFSFDNFSEFYQEKLRIIINREQEDDKENFSKIKSNNRLYKKYKRNNFFLSQKILNIYITFTNNHLKELLNTFKLIKCKYKEEKDTELNYSIINNNNMSNNIDESIYHLYLIQKKLKMGKVLKKQFFGIYDDIKISDIIEHYFVTEKFFSSYTLIKYSFLNVLAVTRIIESKIINNLNIMEIIFDFCDITQLEVKKYMNIYLNIFRIMYQSPDEKFKIKFKIEEYIKKFLFI